MKDADSRIMVVKHRPPLDAPRLPAVLQGRVSVEAAATAAAEPPELLDDTAMFSERTDAFTDEADDPKALDVGSSDVRKAYEGWAGRWKRWAQEELAAASRCRLHQQLYRIAKKIQQDGDSFETVLAVGLLQVGAERASARVRRHILTVPVTLMVDPNSVNVTVSELVPL
ncbi:hypothetical protein OG209_36185 [Streptomyces sp. NBC_01383]|uniref:hypothetical protein n=1 Tax=Streptomyces sp. NBC_01383 TaxID=2903846 RepID=UPI00324EFDC1